MQTQIQNELSATPSRQIREPGNPRSERATGGGSISVPRVDQTGIRKGLLKALAIGTLLALAMMPLSMHAQGKGGGKPGGGGGGGDGGGGEPDYLYTLANVEPPAGTVRIHPLGMNNHAAVVGASYVKGYRGNSEGYSSPFLLNRHDV